MSTQDVITAMELKADYVGFILSEGFKRTVTAETFCSMWNCLQGSAVRKVGVFVNEPPEKIMEYSDKLDLIQLHGNEDEQYIRKLREYTGKPIIRAFKIVTAEDIKKAADSSADHVLLDSGTGTGKTFDHSFIRGLDRPYFLAGGLTSENVTEVIERFHPYAVDASSCLETDGKKDSDKMRRFVNAVRRI